VPGPSGPCTCCGGFSRCSDVGRRARTPRQPCHPRSRLPRAGELGTGEARLAASPEPPGTFGVPGASHPPSPHPSHSLMLCEGPFGQKNPPPTAIPFSGFHVIEKTVSYKPLKTSYREIEKEFRGRRRFSGLVPQRSGAERRDAEMAGQWAPGTPTVPGDA